MSAGKRDISCKELRESLAAYLDDELTPDERELIESHLSACRQCSEKFASAIDTYDRIKDAAQTFSEHITPSENIWLGIKSRLSVEEHATDTTWGLARAKFRLGKEIAMKALFSKRPVWKLAAISGFVIIGLVVGLTIGMPSDENAYAQAERIASESQEVQAALGGEVAYANTISLQDNIGTLVCSGETGGMAAVTVDIGNKSVTDVLPIELTVEEEQQAIAIAMADSRIKELVDQGAVIGNVSPDYSLGNGVNAGTRYVLPNIMIAARMSLELDYQLWYITVNLDEEKVQDFVLVPKTLISMAVISPEQVWQVIAIAKADTRVKELLDQGAVIVRAGSGVAYQIDGGNLESTTVVLALGDRRWNVAINLIKGQVTSVSEDPFGNISSEEFEELVSYGYAMAPLEVREILGIVESDEAVKALMTMGAEIFTIRPVLEWECDTVGNESGVLRQVCYQKDGQVERVDVMLGHGITWWDVIVDLDLQKVVEIREYFYDSGQGYQSGNGSGSTSTADGQSVDWKTNLVKLAADDFYINASGVKYIANVQSVEITSDPGDSEYCTLELIWHEHGNEMRLNMYFRSDGTYWWSDEIRTYNGQQYPEADWIIYTGEFFKTELGSPFVGNIDFISDPDNNYSGTIHFGGLELQAFLDAD